MGFDDQHVDASQLDDRRGMSSGARLGAGAGGLGIVGVLVLLLINVLGGGSGGGTNGLDQVLGGPGTGTGATASSDVATRCNTSGAIDAYDDCYVLKVFNELNEVWGGELPRYGADYRNPRLVFFERAVSTGGCGSATSQTGPFYCPPDERVYVDLGFLDQLLSEFGVSGRYAQAYVVAHEVGHHLQNLLGTEAQVRKLQRQHPNQVNALSVRMELQADCYAGVWAALANERGNYRITEAQYQEALAAAAAVGDDRIQSANGGQVNPESWTHGSSKQRQKWFSTGYQTGDPRQCNTFRS